MADFEQIWNATLDKDDLPDLVASLTVESLNDVLKVHRNKAGDKAYYQRQEKFLDENGAALFSAEVIVGGDKSEHTAGTANPLAIELLDSAPAVGGADGFTYVYERGNVRNAPAADTANAIITAQDVNFYFAWPSSSGGPAWNTHLADIQFKMEVMLRQTEIISDTGQVQQGLEIRPLKLRVSKASTIALRDHLRTSYTDQKTEDLFFALLNYIALSVGPNLAKVVKFPVMAVADFSVMPMLFAVTKSAVTVGAKLNLAERVDVLAERLASFEQGFWAEVDADLHEARLSGAIALEGELEFPKATAFARAYRASLGHERARTLPRESDAGGSIGQDEESNDSVDANGVASLAGGQIGVAINEFLLDAVVSKFGNINKQGKTGWLTLIVVRGRAGYELRVGTIDIDVQASGITGGAPINAFGGIYYQLKEWDDCGWEWGRERKLGLGVKGTPKIKLKTVPSNGLSILANFELGGLKFYTGAGFPIDDLVGKLSKPLMEVVEAVLDTIALGISFVVIPVELKIPDQATVVRMKQFTTGQYKHTAAPASSRNNYAKFTTQTNAA
jgi:hypothetical protein